MRARFIILAVCVVGAFVSLSWKLLGPGIERESNEIAPTAKVESALEAEFEPQAEPEPVPLPKFNTDEQGVESAPPEFDVAERFEREAGQTEMAAKMESNVRVRLSESAFKKMGLQDLQLTELECRRTVCRLVLEYPLDFRQNVLMKANLPYNTSPARLFVYEADADDISGVVDNTETFSRQGQTWRRETSFQAYARIAMNPNTHEDWVHAALLKRMKSQ